MKIQRTPSSEICKVYKQMSNVGAKLIQDRKSKKTNTQTHTHKIDRSSPPKRLNQRDIDFHHPKDYN